MLLNQNQTNYKPNTLISQSQTKVITCLITFDTELKTALYAHNMYTVGFTRVDQCREDVETQFGQRVLNQITVTTLESN